MFHNKHTITIGRLSLLMDSQNINLVKRWNMPMPKCLVRKYFKKLMTEVKESLNKTALKNEIEKGIIKARLYNRAFNLYPALVNICSISWNKEQLDRIEEITGIKLVKLDDRDVLVNETKRLQDKYSELSVEDKKENGVSFEKIIISTEILLDLNISRDTKLYAFQHYMEAASDKIKQAESR